MSEKKEPRPISRRTRAYVSLIFLFLIFPTVILWMIFVNPYFASNQALNVLILFILVWLGLAGIPWLPVLFPRE